MKRSRAIDDDMDDDDEETKPPPKKAKGRGKKAAAETADPDLKAATPIKKTRAPKKAKPTSTSSDLDTVEDQAPPAKTVKSKAKKAGRVVDPPVEDEVSQQPKKRRGRAKKASVEED